MNRKILLLTFILGLVLQANGQIANNTSGNNTSGNQTSGNETAPFDVVSAFMWQYDYIHALSPDTSPTNVTDGIKKFLDQLSNQTLILNQLAIALVTKNLSSGNASLGDIPSLYQSQLDYEGSVYGSVSNLLNTLEYAKDNLDCYNIFNAADLQAFVGITAGAGYAFNNDTSMESELKQKVMDFCEYDVQNTATNLNALLDIVIGTDSSCDLLQDLYNGLLPLQIFRGYRDLIANAFGYIMLDVQWSEMILTGCYSLNGVTDAAQNVTSQYQDKVQQAIDRFNQFDQNITSNPNATIEINLQAVIDMFANSSSSLSPLTAATEIDYVLPVVYPWLDWLIFVYSSSNSSSNDSTVVQCTKCVQLEDQNGIDIVVAWVGHNTTSSLVNSTFDQLSSNATSAEQLVTDIFSANNCASGVIAISSDVNQYIIEHLDDRYQEFNTSSLNVYVWGVQEDCEVDK